MSDKMYPAEDMADGDITTVQTPAEAALEHLAEVTWSYAIGRGAQATGVPIATPLPLDMTGRRDEFIDLLAKMIAPIRKIEP